MKIKAFLIVALTFATVSFGQTPGPGTSSSPASTRPADETSVPSEATSRAANHKNNAPYIEGPIWVLTLIKTKSGMNDEYIRSLTGSVKPVYDEEKKQKVIVDYKILYGDASGDRDFNIIIMVEYPNLAALDNLRDKTDPIIDRIIGPQNERSQMAVKTLDIREIVATKTMREIWLK
jgi:hypothetical protein